MTAFDVIIVGAGAAGCVLANRLSADPGRRVLLLEAGGREPPLASRMPAAWISLINSEVDWGYHTVPQRHCFGRRLVWPRGKLVGGSGATNALIYMRGMPSDYDRWAAKGATGWGWQDVLPWFRKSERNRQFAGSPLHGGEGELVVQICPSTIRPSISGSRRRGRRACRSTPTSMAAISSAAASSRRC